MWVQKIRSYKKMYAKIKVESEIQEAFQEFDKDEHRQIQSIREHLESYEDKQKDIQTLCSESITEDIALRNQELQNVYLAIETLNPKQKRRLALYYHYDLTQSAIAKLEGVSQSTIKRSIDVSVRKIRNYLKRSDS